jgi:CHAT domain-containing protein
MGRPLYGGVEVSKKEIKPKTEEFEKAIQLVKRSPELKVDDDIKRIFFDPSTWQDLKATEKEVDNICSILKANPKYVFKFAGASEDRIKEYSAKGRLKDFACHGKAIDEPSSLSCLILTQDKDPDEDGFLTVGEVYGLELDCDLVTLSACELALGGMKRGEGVIGLTRAFMYAGAPSVIASLWSVADEPTAELMIKMYDKLDKGLDKDKSLQNAQVELMKTYQDPFFWAPFVLYGDWR